MSDRDDATDEYLLGCEPAELQRLALQHHVWGEANHALWRRAGFVPGQQLIDVGCGPGFASLDLAQIVGAGGRVVAIDESRRFVNHLNEERDRHGLDQIETRVGRVEDVELEPENYDGAYARWIFCFLENPTALIDRLHATLRPGGKLVVVDYFDYRNLALTPRPPAIDRAIAAAYASWKQSGGSLDVGNDLPALLEQNGFDVTDIETRIEVARPGTMYWNWPKLFFWGYIPKLIEWGLLTEADQVAFHEEWLERERTPGAYFLTPPLVEIIARKRG